MDKILKTFKTKNAFSKDDSFCIEVTNNAIRINYINRVESTWVMKYYTLATKDKPTFHALYWNPDEREIIDYLLDNKIGTFHKIVEPNYDEDPNGNKVQFGTRSWYTFDFSKLFNL